MDEEDLEQEQPQKQQGGNPLVEGAKEKGKEVAKKEIKEKVKKEAAKKAAKTAAESAAKHSLLAALGPILIWVAIIIVAIIIIVGIIMFFMTVPGMVTQQLKNFAVKLGMQFASYFGADITEVAVTDEEKYEVLDYLEQMGYDLKGYGFITKDVETDAPDDPSYDKKVGVKRDPDTGLIAEANSDIIGLYLMSDNYVYTVKNFNRTGIMQFLSTVLDAVSPLVGHLVTTFLDQNDWGKGLMSIYFENESKPYTRGREYEKNWIDQIFGTATTWTDIEIDAEAKTMKIRRGWGANYYTYNLDGWTGRYGMPLEFLLSVQIATMKPDLAYDMVTNFKTDVQILLRNISSRGSEVISYYKTGSGYVSYPQVEKALTGYEGRNPISAGLAWFDDLSISGAEAKNVFALGIEHADSCNCTKDADGNVQTVGSNCKAHIKEILSAISDANDYDGKTYVPFISQVTNHWFRDVYFVLEDTSKELIQTDIDYERKMNERWTLYEKYTEEENADRAGEYKLYKFDYNADNGIGELYDGTQADADAEGVAVVKKPITATIKDLANQGVVTWESGIWSAYEDKDTTSEDYERAFPDEDENTVKGKVYYKSTLAGNVVQKEDAVRGVTNKEIKKMFLENKYFSYDGTAKTADVIAEARKQLGVGYGAVDPSNLDKTITATVDGETEEYSVKDLVSTVSITQDSLGAFSMLENTHTLDADYIYKDFKELIVELGYFTKEELSEGTPKLLEFLVPDIGSGGYPKRVLDKKENEYGTQLHSKEDYEVNQKNTLKALVEPSGQSNAENGESSTEEQSLDDLLAANRRTVNKYIDQSNELVDSLNKQKATILDEQSFAADADKASYDAKLAEYDEKINQANTINQEIQTKNQELEELEKKFSETTDETEKKSILEQMKPVRKEILDKQKEIENLVPKVEYKRGHSIDPNTNGVAGIQNKKAINSEFSISQNSNAQFQNIGETEFKKDTLIDTATACWQYIVDAGNYTYAGASIPPTGGTTIDCSSYVSWVLYEYGFEEFAGAQHCTSDFYNTNWNEAFGWEEISVGPGEDCSSQIQPGDLFVRDDGNNNGHIQFILSVEDDGTILTYDCGSASHWVSENREGYKSDFTKGDSKNRPGKIIRIENAKPKTGSTYEGFEGGEAVVSPVTGVLLDYGTYTDEDVDSLTGEKYRTNSDKKDKTDKVGYAKILVLNEEISDQIVKCTDEDHKRAVEADGKTLSNGIIQMDTPPEDIEGFDRLDIAEKGLYGYSLFKDDYEDGGIAGYIVYIDGFKLELPGTTAEENKENEENSGSTEVTGEGSQPSEGGSSEQKEKANLGSGQMLDMSYFIENASKGGIGNFTEGEYMETRYEADEVYKLLSEKITKQQEARAEAKKVCVPLYQFAGTVDGEYKDDWIIIKEGTVIGRTLSNQELVEEYRNETYTPPEEQVEEVIDENGNVVKENTSEVQGNYLRIIMRDLDDTVVENVEDYMKLDEEGEAKANTEVDWEFYYWLPYESGPMDAENGGPAAADWTTPGELACGIAQWTTYSGCNNIGPLCEWLVEQNPSLCSELTMFKSISSSNVTSMGEQFRTAWRSVAKKDRDAFLELQMQYFYEKDFEDFITGKTSITRSDISGWVKKKPMVFQGTLASLMNWGQGLGWEKPEVIKESNDDKTNIKNLLKKACGIGSTAGSLASRWTSQYVLAIDILEGNFTEVEEWIKTKAPLKYNEGQNPGSLSSLQDLFHIRSVSTYANK